MKQNKPLIQLKHVSFKTTEQVIIDDFNLDVFKGEMITITGPSGSGKSTLLKMMALLISPTSGDILYQGQSIESYSSTLYRQEVSYFFQNATLFGNTVKDNLIFPSEIRHETFNKQKAIELLEKVDLNESYLNQSVDSLSGGEKQRIALIRNLMYQPEVLLMDEVTSSLDRTNREIILNLIQELNQSKQLTVLAITHNEEEIQSSSRLITLDALK
ncbi:ABC transporter ATP-binding protein [Atopobacter phocae]|uniref:ABC transporter ATP-binding protein n=1 Tax=Atopobacter phocae TaxID=136492 RepID=UPI0004BA7C72|nr:ATP-binding cassette domain-containing protein [Atopobacter phocae]